LQIDEIKSVKNLLTRLKVINLKLLIGLVVLMSISENVK
jgi:hypothetical protein